MKKLIGLGLFVAVLVPSMAWSTVGGGDVTFRPPGADMVVFSHDLHVGKASLKCNDCHYKLFSIVGKNKKKATMADMEKGQSCGACHNGTRAFEVKKNCTKCHK
jgi:c(7)-type cytochrome triheme protein